MAGKHYTFVMHILYILEYTKICIDELRLILPIHTEVNKRDKIQVKQ